MSGMKDSWILKENLYKIFMCKNDNIFLYIIFTYILCAHLLIETVL